MTLVRFLMDPSVSGILLGIGFAGLLIEMLTMGLVAGSIGAIALALYFAAHVVSGAADAPAVGLAIIGLLGILCEFYLLPGFAVPGILGGLALFAAAVLALGAPPIVVAAQSLAIAIVVTVALVVVAVRVVPERALVRRLTVGDPDGVHGAAPDYRALVGRHGVAASYLRPAGYAAIDAQRVDVLTEGEFVAAGTAIVVTRVEGARIFVRPEVTP
jgi:membrane-bound serine protease (ClpP class)